MEYSYSSLLSGHIHGLLAEKRACGWPYNDGAYMLKSFDAFMAERFPESGTVTREACLAWAERRAGEGPDSLLNRISQVRQLSLYMNRMGTWAHVPDAKQFARPSDPQFRVLAPGELDAFFNAARAWEPAGGRSPWPAPWPAPAARALFAMLYCLGLRPCEALRMGVGDVDLRAGTALVRQSKGDKDRRVFLSEDLAGLLARYNQEAEAMLPGRGPLFPNWKGGHCPVSGARRWFLEIWRLMPPDAGPAPSLMAFRHTFATERVRAWSAEGADLRNRIYYLSLHMGHKSVAETEHYLHLAPHHFPEMLAKASAASRYVVPKGGGND